LVHRHGGKPIGSLDTDALVRHGTSGSLDVDIYPLHNQPVNPLFFDCTHDNETPFQKRVPQDSLPTGALVAMCAASTGSVMGYDEIFPRLLDLVNESRLYAPDYDQPGIGKTKGILNRLHTEMAVEGYVETHVHHEGEAQLFYPIILIFSTSQSIVFVPRHTEDTFSLHTLLSLAILNEANV
jgi:glycogen debranching enzyme